MCISSIICIYTLIGKPIIKAKTVIQVEQCLTQKGVADLDYLAPKDPRFEWRCVAVQEEESGTGALR